MSSSQQLMKVADVMSTRVVTAQMSEPVSKAVNRMLERGVGWVVVVVDSEDVAGIITKGDALKRAFLKGFDATQVPAKKIMTKTVITISPDASLEEAAGLMAEKNVSKLPVVKDDKLVGIITSTDIIRAEPMQVGYLEELVKARFVPHDMR